MSKLANLVAAVAMTMAAAATANAAPPAKSAAPPVKNIVLVHGAFADGSSWASVITILQKKGYNVTAVQNPLTTLADDVAATRRAIAAQDGPVILAAHSWGGAVITQAGDDPKVAALVYVAAFAPDVGETLTSLGKGQPPTPAIQTLIVDKEGFGVLSEEGVFKHFVQDLPLAQRRLVAALQGPTHVSLFDTKITSAAWHKKPAWFIVAKRDGTISPDAERFFAQRMHATTRELNSDHVAMLSHPKDVAAAIVEASQKAPH